MNVGNFETVAVLIPNLRGNPVISHTNREQQGMVGEMVQNSQSLYSFTFTAVIVIHEYIYSHSTTKFTFKKYICLHLTTYFLFTNIFTHIYEMYHSHSPAYIRSHSRSKYSFNTVQYSFNIFCALSLRIDRCQLPASPPEDSVTSVISRTFQEKRRKPSIPPCITKPMSPGYGVRQYAISYLGTSHRITMLSSKKRPPSRF